MSIISWRRYVFFLILATIAHPGELLPMRGCPPQEVILPCRCLTRGQEIQVWCSHSNLPKVLEGLRAVGQYLQEPIDELILENNHLPSLPGKAFIPLKVLRLMLRYNGLERVSTTWLSGLEATLMELFIVEPVLRSLPEESLDRMMALEAITIQSNLMKRLPKFAALPKLKHLQIESVSLVEMTPRHFTALPVLEKLFIAGSPRLTRLESGTLQDLPRLALVNISFCGISWLHPRAITHLPALRELSLIGNKITDATIVGRSIRDLPVLETLYLDYNHIEELGEAAFVDLPSLKKLHMSNNKITQLHHGAFHRVPKLRMLDLNNNLVRRVHPESFLQHSGSGLEELWLVKNDISHVAELRSLLDALPRLIFLDMSHNNLQTIPFGALRGHPTLERLHLDHNKIHRIDMEAFMAMPALRELRLKNNTLSDVLNGPMWNLPALKGLDLSENYFRRIEPRLFTNLPSLRKIDLSQNQLAIIDPATFLGNPALEFINISGNILTGLHPGCFRHLHGLYELDSSNNRLVEFVPGLPRRLEYLHMSNNQINNFPPLPTPDLDLPALRMLDLTGNRIKNIPAGTLRSLPELRKFYLGKNSLNQLEDGALNGLSRLEILDLHDNKLIQVHPNALKQTIELRELKLGDNRMSLLRPEVFRTVSHLKKLDVSKNQLTEISSEILENTRDIQIINASHNLLVDLPSSLYGMKHLRILELSSNRLKNINPEMLSSLNSLIELYFSNNLLQELKKGAFNNLLHLKSIDLSSNELEIIESLTFHSLPTLKTLKLSRNKLREIPGHTFNNLPLLQTLELQENRLKIIANNAFIDVPNLLMLNLSNNQLLGLENSGLRSLRSLEMLDLSHNRLSRIASGSLEKMEWLVELRMDNNKICSVYGSPFNGMPRLRVLSMKHNKMMSFPEQAIQKLRGNLAVLDINGNPLECSCNLLWFQAWLQESSATGPRCLDGMLLRDMRISRQDCTQEARRSEPVATGCEAELLSALDTYGPSVFSQWMNLKENTSMAPNSGNKLVQSPEESEYFYDEYIDYPFNETIPSSNLLDNNQPTKNETSVHGQDEPQKSSHYISGDTPTIYAATTKNTTRIKLNNNLPKEVSSSPSSSGFTFFGVPLPNFNLNLNSLLSRGNGRMSPNINNPVSDQQTAERKTAIVNNPPPFIRPNHFNGFLPTVPELQSGGFIPLLPGSGGFKPIPRPQQIPVATVEIERVNISEARWPIVQEASGSVKVPLTTTSPNEDNAKSETSFNQHPSIPKPQIPTLPISKENIDEPTSPTSVIITETTTKVIVTETRPEKTTLLAAEPSIVMKQINTTNVSSKEESTNTNNVVLTTPTTTELMVTSISEIEQAANSDRFEDIFKEFVDNVPIPTVVTPSENITFQAIETLTTTEHFTSTQPTLLVPTVQLSHARPQGRPIIERVHSPHVSGTSPLQADLEISDDVPLPVIHSREIKMAKIEEVTTTTMKINEREEDMSWYYINYNKTKLEPFIGPGGTLFSCSESVYISIWTVLFVLIFVYLGT